MNRFSFWRRWKRRILGQIRVALFEAMQAEQGSKNPASLDALLTAYRNPSKADERLISHIVAQQTAAAEIEGRKILAL